MEIRVVQGNGFALLIFVQDGGIKIELVGLSERDGKPNPKGGKC